MPGIEGALIQTGLGAVEAVVGAINSKKEKRIADELERSRPKRETDPLYGQNLSLVESELAGGGMSAGAERAYNNVLDRQFSSSLDSILRGGGSVNNVADVFDASEQGRQNLALMKDRMRLNQVNNVLSQRTALAEEGDKNFLFNDWAPWADKSVANAQARQGSQNQLWSGLDTAGSGAINASTILNDNNRYEQYFKAIQGNRGVQPQMQQQPYQPYQQGQYSQGGIYGPPTGTDYGFKIDY
jgi:hypothetical protein